MRRSISRLLIGLFAAPVMLASSAALAGSNPCNNIELAASGSCDYEVSGGCKADCVPLSFTAACDGQCTVTASVDCTASCQASCEADCTVNPGSFDCQASCTTGCKANCAETCTETSCKVDCEASCENRCAVRCEATPPSAECSARCQASCGATCDVQANVDCHVKCTADLQGGCEVQCDTPQGALYCDGQYVDLGSSADSCIDYLKTHGLTVQATATCDASGCSGAASVGCAAAPAVGAIDTRTGVGAIAGLMMGLGMIVTRRRRR